MVLWPQELECIAQDLRGWSRSAPDYHTPSNPLGEFVYSIPAPVDCMALHAQSSAFKEMSYHMGITGPDHQVEVGSYYNCGIVRIDIFWYDPVQFWWLMDKLLSEKSMLTKDSDFQVWRFGEPPRLEEVEAKWKPSSMSRREGRLHLLWP